MELQDLTPIHSPELDVHVIVEVKPESLGPPGTAWDRLGQPGTEANLLDQGCRVFPLWWLSHAISKIYYTQPLSLQFVCNHGNHSVVNLFLQ